MTESTPPNLGYSAPPKRRIRRHVLLAAALILLVIAGWYARPRIVRFYATTQAYMWQRRAMAHQLPADTIVYTDDPATANRLLADPRYFRSYAGGPVMYDPIALHEMEQWRQDPGSASHGRGPYGGLFLHARTVPASSEQRLIAVAVLPFGGGLTAGHVLSFYGSVVQPGTLTRFWHVDVNQDPFFNLLIRPNDRFSIFAGQPDPEDPAHFTIDYILNDRRGTIDGLLRSDGFLDLQPRDGVVRTRGRSEFSVWDLGAGPATGPASRASQ